MPFPHYLNAGTGKGDPPFLVSLVFVVDAGPGGGGGGLLSGLLA